MPRNLPAVALLSALCLMAPATAARATPGAATALPVSAFVERGWVFGLRADGRTIRLTAGTHAADPRLSPDRSTIAYFTTARGRADRLTGVWTVGTRANPQHLVANLYGAGPGALAWSPNGRLLAYVHGGELGIWRGPGSVRTAITRLGSGADPDPQPAIVWSPDSRRIAVPLAPRSSQQPPRVLSIAITNTGGQSGRTIRVRFPPRLVGSRTSAAGSHPDASQLAWAADGVNLLVATTINGAGNSLTGIWRVSARGGLAHLVIGSPAGLVRPQADPRFAGATHLLVSPDWRHLATDPGSRFWVSRLDGEQGRFLATHQAVGCVLAQYTWLTGSAGLAYVSLCTVGGTADFRSTLYMLRLQNGRPRPVVTLVGPGMNQLSLAPAFRCIACG